MKTVEIFIDESGDIRKHKPMNITGLAVIAHSVAQRDAFHAKFLADLLVEGMTAGLCESFAPNSGRPPGDIAEAVRMPDAFLPKRPENGDWDGFWSRIHKMADIAQAAASTHKVALVGFSLRFPSSTERRWTTPDAAFDQLLDRPYSECLKDVLELLLYETPQIADAARNEGGCLISVDLPTRTFGALVEDSAMNDKLARAWADWGLDARPERDRETGQAEIVAATLDPADAIEILTTAVNRRRADGFKFQVDRARCCKLVTWSQWAMPGVTDARKRNNKRFWAISSSPRPKQIHFLADYVSNGIFNDSIRPNMDPYRMWFDRGFVLSSATEKAGEWLSAVRAFANGDRVSALKSVHTICASPAHQETKSYHFFRRCATGWPDELTGEDLKRLFAEIL
jgi:hypothetical protein